MKKYISIGLLMLSLNGYSQEQIKKLPLTDAAYVGGNEALSAFLSSKLRVLPQAFPETGTVYIEFLVNTDGTLSDIKVLRGISTELDQLAVNAVREMPRWQPAANEQGESVAAKMVLPIRFKA